MRKNQNLTPKHPDRDLQESERTPARQLLRSIAYLVKNFTQPRMLIFQAVLLETSASPVSSLVESPT